jgi:hypothetical protein
LLPEELKAIIGADELNVNSEEVVWASILWWINHDKEIQNLKTEFEKSKSTNKTELDQLSSEMNANKTKLFASATVGCSSTTLPPSDNISTVPSQASSEAVDNVNFLYTTNESVRISHRVPINCNECMNANVADSANLPVSSNLSPYAPGSCLNPTELSLPYFDDSSKIKAMYHLKQLDEYFTLKGVPKEMQFAIALRSITDPTAKERNV